MNKSMIQKFLGKPGVNTRTIFCQWFHSLHCKLRLVGHCSIANWIWWQVLDIRSFQGEWKFKSGRKQWRSFQLFFCTVLHHKSVLMYRLSEEIFSFFIVDASFPKLASSKVKSYPFVKVSWKWRKSNHVIKIVRCSSLSETQKKGKDEPEVDHLTINWIVANLRPHFTPSEISFWMNLKVIATIVKY